MLIKNRRIIPLCVMFAMVHACNALYVTYVPLFLSDMNFDAAARGVLLSLGPFVAMFTQTIWGAAADRSKNKVRIMVILAIGLITPMLCFLASASGFVGSLHNKAIAISALVTMGLMLYALFHNPMLPMIDTISLEYLSSIRPSVPYGVIRTMGTIAFVITAYVVGILVETSAMGTKIIFYVFLVVIAILLCALVFVPPIKGSQLGKKKTSIRALFSDKWFVVMVIIGFIVAATYGFNGSNYSNYIRDQLGASERIIGINTALGSTFEIFLFFVIHKITKKTGILNLILICVTAATLRWFVTSISTSIPVLIAVQFFTQPFTWGILIYSIAIYIQKAVAEELHARAQALINMIMSSIGKIVGSLAGGWWLGSWGAGSEPKIYLCMSALCFATLIFAVLMFRKMGWGLKKTPEALRLDEKSVI